MKGFRALYNCTVYQNVKNGRLLTIRTKTFRAFNASQRKLTEMLCALVILFCFIGQAHAVNYVADSTINQSILVEATKAIPQYAYIGIRSIEFTDKPIYFCGNYGPDDFIVGCFDGHNNDIRIYATNGTSANTLSFIIAHELGHRFGQVNETKADEYAYDILNNGKKQQTKLPIA